MKRPSFLVIILCAAAAVLLALELSGVLFLALTGLRESVATPLTFIDALLLCRPCGKSMRWVLTLSGGIPAAGLVGLTILAIRGRRDRFMVTRNSLQPETSKRRDCFQISLTPAQSL